MKHSHLPGKISKSLTLFLDCFSGKFREKASILHKIAKKKCQVEDSNGVAGKCYSWKKITCINKFKTDSNQLPHYVKVLS